MGRGLSDWFVVNVRDANWVDHERFGAAVWFDGPEGMFELGFNIRVLQPGKPNALYHRETNEENFLVLAGECLLLVDGQERPLEAWDFVHCAPNVEHIFVGAGDGPCVILMTGTRKEDGTIVYPVSELAARSGASVEEETDSPPEAYAPFGRPEPGRPDGWDDLPWA